MSWLPFSLNLNAPGWFWTQPQPTELEGVHTFATTWFHLYFTSHSWWNFWGNVLFWSVFYPWGCEDFWYPFYGLGRLHRQIHRSWFLREIFQAELQDMPAWHHRLSALDALSQEVEQEWQLHAAAFRSISAVFIFNAADLLFSKYRIMPLQHNGGCSKTIQWKKEKKKWLHRYARGTQHATTFGIYFPCTYGAQAFILAARMQVTRLPCISNWYV